MGTDMEAGFSNVLLVRFSFCHLGVTRGKIGSQRMGERPCTIACPHLEGVLACLPSFPIFFRLCPSDALLFPIISLQRQSKGLSDFIHDEQGALKVSSPNVDQVVSRLPAHDDEGFESTPTGAEEWHGLSSCACKGAY